MINTGSNFHRTLAQQFCLFGASNKLNILSLNFQLMDDSVEVLKVFGLLFVKQMMVFQSLLDCFSIGV